jgi:hypothetical protein
MHSHDLVQPAPDQRRCTHNAGQEPRETETNQATYHAKLPNHTDKKNRQTALSALSDPCQVHFSRYEKCGGCFPPLFLNTPMSHDRITEYIDVEFPVKKFLLFPRETHAFRNANTDKHWRANQSRLFIASVCIL